MNLTWLTNESNTYKFTLVKSSAIKLIALIYRLAIWNKARIIYNVNNWIYTTNHKRIAVNYFWFVIFSGICGMVLATIIRLEMAYPGVGILAGDSLQYLSVVTMHAVIMVFFMIMPLLFGAFGNFLLPTQLGVHDVAFPRLNSAAFWFLPGGLVMLCQLVCLDRRYQRMNCFNIREMQALLKVRFFSDLVNSHDHHSFLNKTVVGLRYKTNNLDVINPNMLLFYRYGIAMNLNNKTGIYTTETGFNAGSFVTNNTFFFSVLDKVLGASVPVWFLHLCEVFFAVSNRFHGAAVVKSSQVRSTGFSLITNVLNSLRSELERQWHGLMGMFDFGEPSWLYLQWYRGCVYLFLDNLFQGYMENNMGFYKERKQGRPEYDHPELYFDGNFFEFIFSGVHRILSKSFFILLRSSAAWVCTFVDSCIADLYAFGRWVFSVLISLSTSKGTFIGDFMFGLSTVGTNLISALGTAVTSFTSTLTIVPSTVGYFYTMLGMGDLNTAVLEQYIASIRGYTTVKGVYTDSTSSPDLLNRSKGVLSTDNVEQLRFGTEETSHGYRYNRFSNPIFRYDYRSGDYVTKELKEGFTHLFTMLNDVTGGIRKAPWFLSETFMEAFLANFKTYSAAYMGGGAVSTDLATSYVSHTDSFYNFFFLLSDSSRFINDRWAALGGMNQKFYKLFATSSMQQRVYANWRQLKFTREAWRCKLLAARHQKTLYKRYLNEDNLVWALERNAKDVLPGWAMITPFSARTRFTAIGKVDLGLMGVALVLNSSIVSSANFLVTYRYLSTLNNRKMRDARAFFTEGVMVASWMMIAANPMLAIGIFMLLSDRHWQTSFFDYSGGGDTVLFQHMFWFFGHPEVYVIMIPAFGFNNTILSYYLRKRVSARASLLYSIYTIAFLGFFVWGHHMYMVGLAHTTRMLFSTLTVMISVPAATKLMHWCVTLANSSFCMELPFLFQLLFIFFFVSGGISGMAVAHTGMDVLFHDTFYVVGHFHVMLAGSAMFASFGAFYFYFPAIFGVKYSRIWGYLHAFYYLVGQLMTVVPMFWLGYSGMPRRVLDYPASLGGWHAVVSAGHMLSVAGMIAFFVMIFDSIRQARAVTRNSFGIVRFNTRLNFYLYELARTLFIQRKGWHLSRFNTVSRVTLNNLNYKNYEKLETTLYSYSFTK